MAFGWLWGKKALPPVDRSQNPSRSLLSTVTAFLTRSSLYKNYSWEIEAKTVLQNSLVYRCVNKIASSVQSVRWTAEIDPNAPEIVQQAAKKHLGDVQSLLDNPGLMSGAEMRYLLASSFALFGYAALKAGVVGGNVNALFPLKVSSISRKIDKYGEVAELVYGDSTETETIKKKPAILDNTPFAFEIRKNDLFLDPNKVSNPLKCLCQPVDIMRLLVERAAEQASETPNVKYILCSKQDISEKLADNLKKNIEDRKIGGAESGNNIMILDGIEASLLSIDDGLSDLSKRVPMEDYARQIIGIFGIPLALMGNNGSDSAKFANNYGESRLSFWEDTIIPEYLAPIEEALTVNICPPGIVVRFDREAIPALLDKRINSAAKLTKVAFLTENEKRAICGYSPKEEKSNGKNSSATL